MVGFMSIWVNKAEYDDYVNGAVAVGWLAKGNYHRFNIIVPLENVIDTEQFSDGSVEITFQQKAQG